ncbi:MAG TPA: hypothetical protein VK961_17735 [Chthoniobacter sp.]|nr:hypothetical protein [Chthoniobacter sp.]
MLVSSRQTPASRRNAKGRVEKIAAIFYVVLTISATVFRHRFEQVSEQMFCLVGGVAIMAPTGLLLYIRQCHPTWALDNLWVAHFPGASFVWPMVLGVSALVTEEGVRKTFHPTISPSFHLIDKAGNSIADALVMISDPQKPDQVGEGGVTDATGTVTFGPIPAGLKHVAIAREGSNHLWDIMEFDWVAVTSEIPKEVKFKRRKARARALPSLRFDSAEPQARPENAAASAPLMDDRLALEKKRDEFAKEPGYLLVLGNTDQVGSDRYNYDLGKRRVTKVMDILRQIGFSGKSMCGFTFGKKWQRPPDFPNAKKDQIREMNRRVEILFVPLAEDRM